MNVLEGQSICKVEELMWDNRGHYPGEGGWEDCRKEGMQKDLGHSLA